MTIEPTKPEAEPERMNENGEPTAETSPRSAGEAAAGTSGLLEASAEAKRIAAAVLEVLAGSRGPSEAASVLGISQARYYQLETRALAGLVAGCEPRRRGTRKGPTELSSLRQECDRALENPILGELLLDAPTLMGVESIEVDTVTLRMVARTLPGKQFEAGRQLRALVIRALAQAGIVTAADAKVGVVDGPGVEAAEAEQEEYEKTHDPVQR